MKTIRSSHLLGNLRTIRLGWALAAVAIMIPIGLWAHGEVEGAGEEQTRRIVEGKSGKYRLELMVSPSLPAAGEATNFELKVIHLLPKPDPLLGSEVPVTAMPSLSLLSETSKKMLVPAIPMHNEGEAGVFGVDEYKFPDSGSLMLRFLIHTGAGEDLAADFPVSVKTNVAALFRLWVNLAIAGFIAGLVGLRLWKICARGGERGEMLRPVAIGLACWLAIFLLMDFFILDKVLGLRKPAVSETIAPTAKANDDGTVTIPAEVQKTLGIALVAAKEIPVEQTLTAAGTVMPRPDLTADVVAPLWGRVEFSKDPLAVGDTVKRGQELVRVVLELSQVERAPLDAKALDIKGALARAKDRKDAAQVEYDRAQKLFAADHAYEQDLKWAKTLLDEATETYQQIDKEDKGIPATYKFRDPRRTPVNSPINGTITFIGFTPGQLDLNGESIKLFTITDTSAVWVRADVFLADVLKLKTGDAVAVHPATRPAASIRGTIHWIGDTVDATTRTVPVLVDVANPDGTMAIGGYAQIDFSHARQKSVAVPERAVVDDGTTKRIYLAVGPDKFQPVTVEVGIQKDGWRQVISGVQSGDQVIANGAGLLGSIHLDHPLDHPEEQQSEALQPDQRGSLGNSLGSQPGTPAAADP